MSTVEPPPVPPEWLIVLLERIKTYIDQQTSQVTTWSRVSAICTIITLALVIILIILIGILMYRSKWLR